MTHSRLPFAVRLLAASLLLPALAQAASITADGTLCTLADAIRAANNDGIAFGGCALGSGADVIQLTADESITVAEAGASGSTNTHGGIAGLPDVVSTITIEASGGGDRIERQAGLACASAQVDAFRIFNVLGAGNLTLVGITVANGCIAPAGPAYGGGFFLAATGALALQQSTVSGNTARGNDDALAGGVGFGGAIYAVGGTVTFSTATFTGNTARAGDGAAGGTALGGALAQEAGSLAATDSTFSGNLAVGGTGGVGGGAAIGGAFSLAGSTSATIATSSFLGNTAQGGDGRSASGDANGGAVATVSSASIVTLTSSLFADNLARAGSDFLGPGAAAMGGALDLRGGANGVFERLIVRNNRATGGSGGLHGSPASGGGLHHAALSLAALRKSHFFGNTARGGGGIEVGAGAFGGGLAVSAQLAEISDSTFSGNLAQGGGGGSSGGGAEGGGMVLQSQALLVINTTVYANVAQGSAGRFGSGTAGGGGVNGGGSITLRHVTVAANQAQSSGITNGGGIYGTFTLDNTVLADNLVVGGTMEGADCYGTVTSAGFNHAENPDATCVLAAAGDVVGSDPLLGPFGVHGCTADRVLPDGGCAPTVALLLTSLPIDAGSCTVSGATVDERGFPRPVDIAGVANAADACDQGAFELQESRPEVIPTLSEWAMLLMALALAAVAVSRLRG